MEFGPFALISLLYAVLGLRVVAQLVRSWRTVFDRRFTAADRALVDQAAFFVLVPVSVALHELGHAAAIRLYGGTIEGWGYFGFAGYVAFNPRQFSAPEEVAIAAAGTLVNIALGALASGLVFLRRPPMRAAINELLLQFTFISLLNALVVYPLLDVLTGLNGDWSQMYFGGAPALSAAILVVHAGLLGLLLWAWRSETMRRRVAALTGQVAGPRRIALAGARRTGAGSGRIPIPGRDGRQDGASATAGTPDLPDASSGVEGVLTEAARRVAAGWPVPVEAAIQRRPDGTLLVLSWDAGGARRAVLALARETGAGVALSGAVVWSAGAEPQRRPLAEEPGSPDADRLTFALRVGMEAVETWRPSEPAPIPQPERTR